MSGPLNEEPLTEEQQKVVDGINQLSQFEMARLQRFAPFGHPYFNTTFPYYRYFKKRFAELGGMSHEISKTIGW